jgi:hypothetical protein
MDWQPDETVSRCNECKAAFNYNWFLFTSNKHHCRLCGMIYCDECSKNRNLLPSSYNLISGLTDWFNFSSLPLMNKQRTCDKCSMILQMRSGVINVIDMIGQIKDS